MARAFWDFNLPSIQKHFNEWNVGCAFKIESIQYLNDLNEGFEVIESQEEEKENTFLKKVNLKQLDKQRRKELEKARTNNEFQIILPLSFTVNNDFLVEESKT